MADPNSYVVERIAHSLDAYVNSFHLFDADTLLQASASEEGAQP